MTITNFANVLMEGQLTRSKYLEAVNWIIKEYEEKPETWTQAVFARDKYGYPVAVISPSAISWDIYGMIMRAEKKFEAPDMRLFLEFLFPSVMGVQTTEEAYHHLSMVYSYEQTVSFLKRVASHLRDS